MNSVIIDPPGFSFFVSQSNLAHISDMDCSPAIGLMGDFPEGALFCFNMLQAVSSVDFNLS